MKRKIDSYQKGELVNGIEFVKHTSKGTQRKAMFICPYCSENWETRWYNVFIGSSNKCGKCRSKQNYIDNNNFRNKTKPVLKSLINEAFYKIKKAATERNIDFNLSYEYVINLVTKNCEYCGCEPNQLRENKLFKFKHHGIDRVENKLPYIESNVVSCCTTCNRGKNALGIKEWYNYLDNLVMYRNKIIK